MLRFALLLSLFLSATSAIGADSPPRSHDPRVRIDLFAEHPQIVTPTGIDIDAQGRLWAVESNTHFPPAGYKGHPTDRVWVMTDADGDGKCDKSVMFLDGLTFTMSVAVRPLWLSLPPADQPIPKTAPTVVYLASRRQILMCADTNGDLVCDEQKPIIKLETKGDYPHNGLAGIAFAADGWMYFGCGENLGADYKLVGSDGKSLSGGGEGGNMYRCQLDGSQLTHWATGFWNPHASCIDSRRNLFTVDNDADSRPPCRLLHIIQGGDYGYRYRNGRKGLHPFTAWNGEIPGTLPMVAGTGEAPSGILSYENSALPDDYRGNLLVTSWGDHRIDRFRLKPQGASFTSLPEPLISGGEDFRPVGIACAPDGSLYCTDWVKRDYNLHGHGRVWKISPVTPSQDRPIDLWSMTTLNVEELMKSYKSKRLEERRMAIRLMMRLKETKKSLQDRLAQDSWMEWPTLFPDVWIVKFSDQAERDPFFLALNIRELAADRELRNAYLKNPFPTAQLAALLATSRAEPKSADVVRQFMDSKEPRIQRAVIQWIAEARLTEFRPQVAATLDDPQLSADLFLVTLAALEMLDGVPPADFDKTPPGKYVLPIVRDAKRPPLVRALALRLVPPADPGLDAALLDALWKSSTPELQRETLRTMAQSPLAEAIGKLREIAQDKNAVPGFRLEAIDGLANVAVGESPRGPVRAALIEFLSSSDKTVRLAAIRSLRGMPDDPQARAALVKLGDQWKSKEAKSPADIELAEQIVLALGEETSSAELLAIRNKSRPRATEHWQELLRAQAPGDAVAGRRVFYHAQSAGCFKCHTVEGRGGRIGPDLSSIGRTQRRDKLIDSIVDPSAEVAPQFTSWVIETHAGKTYTGMIVFENEGRITLGMSDGQTVEFPNLDIAERTAQKQSVMPETLVDRLTVQEFRDLLAYLESLK